MNGERIFVLGQEVWFAQCGTRQVVLVCPVCCGKLKVTVILGDDTRVEVPCDFCSRGLDGPCGSIADYEYMAEPKLVKITRIDENTSPAERRYYSYHYSLDDDLIFFSETEARKKCEEVAAEHAQQKAIRLSWSRKSDQCKSYAWKVGYHLREAKKRRKEAEWHDKAAQICKAAQKTKGGGR